MKFSTVVDDPVESYMPRASMVVAIDPAGRLVVETQRGSMGARWSQEGATILVATIEAAMRFAEHMKGGGK